MSDKKVVTLSRAEFAETFLYLNGAPFSLERYPHMRAIYNTDAKITLAKTSRQVAKSTMLANIILAQCAMQPYFKALYVSPRMDQTKLFSHERIAPVIEQSPILKNYYTSTKLEQNVFTKQFTNGSRVFFRYALLSADAIRGISADACFIDEIQDINIDFLPVIEATMFRSLMKLSFYAGTPKHSKGTLSKLWFQSSMCEYMIKCQGCNSWNTLLEENIGLVGPICSRCGKLFSPNCQAQWVSSYPNSTKTPNIDGYRISALHFANAEWVDWHKDIVVKRELSPSKATFYNEVLGLEYDDGVAPITIMELQAACDDSKHLSLEPDRYAEEYKTMLGIDYGPINSENSNTVMVGVQKRAEKYHIVFAKKFIGKEADYSFIHKEVPRLMSVWNASHLAADYGMGESANSEIRSRVGFEKVIAFQHNDAQKEIVKWNEKMPAYTLNRSAVFNNIFAMIKRREIVFPAWEEFEHYADDILNIQAEYNEEKNKIKFINTGPDDFFHAMCYAIISLKLMHREVDTLKI